MVRILIVFPISGLWSMSVLFANHGQVRVLGRGQGIHQFINFVDGQTDACHSLFNVHGIMDEHEHNVFSLNNLKVIQIDE